MNDQRLFNSSLSPWFDDDFDAFLSTDFNSSDAALHFPSADSGLIDWASTQNVNTVCGAPPDLFMEACNSEDPGAIPSSGLVPSPLLSRAMESDERSLEPKRHTLPRRRSKYILRRTGSKTNPIPIRSPTVSPCQFGMNSLAMQRWQNSPPEDEAASLSAIYNALDDRTNAASPLYGRSHSHVAFQKYRVPSSTTSLDSAASESSLRSGNSGHSATSQKHVRGRGLKSRSKAKAKVAGRSSSDRIFKCTFCCDTFKHKYDWSRHEKSLHLNMEEWVCTPHGGSVILPLTGRVHCAYCTALDPTTEHLQQHNHAACVEGRSTPRVFRRKDHLVQHLRLVHGLETLPLIDDWKIEAPPIKSRCGFCNTYTSNWDERTDHLAAHFRQGKTMADWEGDHGFDPSVTARLTNAFPPYLIAAQSTTLIPFSATDPAALDHTSQLLSRIELEASGAESAVPNYSGPESDTPMAFSSQHTLFTQQEIDTTVFADILSRHLSRFAREQIRLGIIPTDEMFQRESRRLLYHDGEDNWNQTVADDPIWLQEFRQQMGYAQRPPA